MFDIGEIKKNIFAATNFRKVSAEKAELLIPFTSHLLFSLIWFREASGYPVYFLLI